MISSNLAVIWSVRSGENRNLTTSYHCNSGGGLSDGRGDVSSPGAARLQRGDDLVDVVADQAEASVGRVLLDHCETNIYGYIAHQR
jgi:hypothetical protein